MRASEHVLQVVASAFIALCVTSALLAAPPPGVVDETLRNQYPGTPIPGLSSAELQEFERGFDQFSRIWTAKDGLGPTFNANSCVACHHNPLPGGNEFARSTFVAHAPTCRDFIGGSSCSKFSLDDGRSTTRPIPEGAHFRKPQSLFGLGMLESIPSSTLEAIAKAQLTDADGVRGLVGRTPDGRVGRFGWKARFASIEDFVLGAFNAELGITSAAYALDGRGRDGAIEIDAAAANDIVSFLTLLAAPPKTDRGDVAVGESLFHQMRCSACHVPSLRTGDSNVPLLNNRVIFAYTDLLLHDLGPALADAVDESGVGISRFRTPPLWGLNASGPPYLHNGSARSIEESIVMHGGEAEASVRRYRALPDRDRNALLRFLNSI